MNTETEPQQKKCNYVYIQLNSRYEQIEASSYRTWWSSTIYFRTANLYKLL